MMKSGIVEIRVALDVLFWLFKLLYVGFLSAVMKSIHVLLLFATLLKIF